RGPRFQGGSRRVRGLHGAPVLSRSSSVILRISASRSSRASSISTSSADRAAADQPDRSTRAAAFTAARIGEFSTGRGAHVGVTFILVSAVTFPDRQAQEGSREPGMLSAQPGFWRLRNRVITRGLAVTDSPETEAPDVANRQVLPLLPLTTGVVFPNM